MRMKRNLLVLFILLLVPLASCDKTSKADEPADKTNESKYQKEIELAKKFTKEFFTLRGREEGEIGGLEYVAEPFRDELREVAYKSFGVLYNDIVKEYGKEGLFKVKEVRVEAIKEGQADGHKYVSIQMSIQWDGENHLDLKNYVVSVGKINNVLSVVGVMFE